MERRSTRKKHLQEIGAEKKKKWCRQASPNGLPNGGGFRVPPRLAGRRHPEASFIAVPQSLRSRG